MVSNYETSKVNNFLMKWIFLIPVLSLCLRPTEQNHLRSEQRILREVYSQIRKDAKTPTPELLWDDDLEQQAKMMLNELYKNWNEMLSTEYCFKNQNVQLHRQSTGLCLVVPNGHSWAANWAKKNFESSMNSTFYPGASFSPDKCTPGYITIAQIIISNATTRVGCWYSQRDARIGIVCVFGPALNTSKAAITDDQYSELCNNTKYNGKMKGCLSASQVKGCEHYGTNFVTVAKRERMSPSSEGAPGYGSQGFVAGNKGKGKKPNNNNGNSKSKGKKPNNNKGNSKSKGSGKGKGSNGNAKLNGGDDDKNGGNKNSKSGEGEAGDGEDQPGSVENENKNEEEDGGSVVKTTAVKIVSLMLLQLIFKARLGTVFFGSI